MRSFLVTAVVLVGLALPAIAQDAEVGKEYNITIQTEQTNQYTGAYGEAKVGSIAFDVPNAKKDEKYHVKVTDIKSNQYTGNKQASCEFQQQGGGTERARASRRREARSAAARTQYGGWLNRRRWSAFLERRKSLVYDACIQPKPVCRRHEARVPGERRPNAATDFNEVGSFGRCGGWRDRYLARIIYGG